jgi:succinate-semialdehyde dehydrogenase/glutarate-semialdehyde dehydrogenase
MGNAGGFIHPAGLREAVSDPSLILESAFIGGKWVSSKKTFPVYDPATNKSIAHIADLGQDDFTRAINHGETAFKSFQQTDEHKRSRMLHRWAELIRSNIKDLAVIITIENGKTFSEAVGEIEYSASFITWFAEEAVRSYGDIIPS